MRLLSLLCSKSTGFILLYFKMHRASPTSLPAAASRRPPGARDHGPGVVPSPLFPLGEAAVLPVCITKSKTHQQHHTQARGPCELRAGREPAIALSQPQGAGSGGWKAAGWVCGLAWVPSLWACASASHASLHLVSPQSWRLDISNPHYLCFPGANWG